MAAAAVAPVASPRRPTMALRWDYVNPTAFYVSACGMGGGCGRQSSAPGALGAVPLLRAVSA